MGQKLKIWATMTSIILLSGMLGFGFSPDAFAGHVDDKGKSLGCINGVAKNNPHCEEEPSDPLSSCDTDGDGTISAEELAENNPPLTLSEAQALVAQHDLDASQSIDTQDEVDSLNTDERINCV